MANDLHDLRDGRLSESASLPTAADGAGAILVTEAAEVSAPVAEGSWPVEPADIWVVERGRPVGVCTSGDPDLARLIAAEDWEQLAVAGPLVTENIGIEKLVRNVLAAPWLRVLVVAGPEAAGTSPTGHYAADALFSLLAHGIEAASMRIVGARGRRPILRNLTPAEVEAFRTAVTVVDRRGELRVEAIRTAVVAAADGRGVDAVGPAEKGEPPTGLAVGARPSPSGGYRPDPAGYVLLFVDRARGCVVLEHYTNEGTRTAMLTGDDPAILVRLASEQGLVGRSDHAAYLARELRRATDALRGGGGYVQDATP